MVSRFFLFLELRLKSSDLRVLLNIMLNEKVFAMRGYFMQRPLIAA